MSPLPFVKCNRRKSLFAHEKVSRRPPLMDTLFCGTGCLVCCWGWGGSGLLALAAEHKRAMMGRMDEKRPRTSLAGIFIAMAAICAVLAFWRVSPDDGEWNLFWTATTIAFVTGTLTSRGILLGMLLGSGFIVISLLMFIEQDVSGLGPPSITIPIQLIFAAFPIALAAWLGCKLSNWLSARH
jgi:hypothetical protein